MNPFTWPDGRFLVAYLLLAGLALAVCYLLWYRTGRGAKEARVNDLTGDPYRIACLRGGADESLRIALFNLADRNLIVYRHGLMQAARPEMLATLKRPLDRAIVKRCKEPTPVKKLLRDRALRKAAREYSRDLRAGGLVSDGASLALRRTIGLAAAGLLAGGAIGKIHYALWEGGVHPGYLVFAGTVVVLLTATISWRTRTDRGERMLASLRTLASRLKSGAERLQAGGRTNEALLIAAVFGLQALPLMKFPTVAVMFPQPVDSGGGGSGGDSCGSSCSSSCGGGGGCGGCGS
jgi:uncharacterized protein (TIGR04222 family)